MLKLKKLMKEAAEYEDVFGIEIARVVQNGEDVAYRVFKSSGGRTIGNSKEHSIGKFGEDGAFEKAKKEALAIVKGWK